MPQHIPARPPLFHSEPLGLAKSDNWWESESATVFWGYQGLDIRLVMHYRLFQNEDLPRRFLLDRHVSAIDAIFEALVEPCEQQSFSGSTYEQKVDKILLQCSPTCSQEVLLSWGPPLPGPSLNAQAIAHAIEVQSHIQLSTIAFEDIVRALLGYTAPSVKWFLVQHEALYNRLLDHLKSHPHEISIYEEVEEVDPQRALGYNFPVI